MHLENEKDAELLFHLFVEMGSTRDRALAQLRHLATLCERFDKLGSSASLRRVIDRLAAEPEASPTKPAA